MSSTVGIGLTPEYTLDRPLRNVKFHWTTDYGYFISWGTADYKVHILESDITIGPENIYWSYSPEKVNEEKSPVKITLKIEGIQAGKTLAEATLDIGWESTNTAKVINY